MSTSFIYKATELDAVNTLLNAIGSSQVNSLENPQNVDAINAREMLRRAVRDVQNEKWYFNTEDNYRLSVDANTGKIPIPTNLIAIDFMGRYGKISPYVIRKGFLYDKIKHTYQFEGDVCCNVQWCFEFDELPETAKHYAIARAARQFQEVMLGDPNLRTWTRDDEAAARAKLLDDDLNTRKLTFGIFPKIDPNVGMDFRDVL